MQIYLILFFQAIGYLALVPMLLYGDWYHYIIAFTMYFLYNGIGMIMTYHRLLSHRVFECPKWLEYVMASLATFSITGSAITWVAMHRKHHRYTDTEKDPHSPDYLGWWRVQFLTAFAPIEGKYAVELMRDKFYKFQHKYYLHILSAFSILLISVDPFALIYIFLFPAGSTLFFGTLVLSTCHKDCKPRNIFWLGIITFGDAFHKVHHQDARMPRLHKYDLVGYIIEKFFVHDKTAVLG